MEPLTDDLMQIMRGFQESRVILTAIELDIFTAVGAGSAAAEAAAKIGANVRATEMLLNALTSMRLLTKAGEVFHNTPESSKYFVEGSPDDARVSSMHIVHLWNRWSTLTECVRAGSAVFQEEMVDRGEDWTRPFIAAMHRNAAERAPLVVKAVGQASRMLDIGGGSGAYSIAFTQANPSLRAEIFDLPTVIPIAQGHINDAGLSDRVSVRAGDLRIDEFGGGYDLAFISAICHMLGPSENRDLLVRAFRALIPGGRIVIQDFILEPDKTAPKSAALFALNMLVGTQNGSSYSAVEYADWLREAGFDEVRHMQLPGPSGLMVAVRAK
jgi:predicted O-methyltransferase YrrM